MRPVRSTGMLAIITGAVAVPVSLFSRPLFGFLALLLTLVCAGLLVAGGILLNQRNPLGRTLITVGAPMLLLTAGLGVAGGFRRRLDSVIDILAVVLPVIPLALAVVLLVLALRQSVAAALSTPYGMAPPRQPWPPPPPGWGGPPR